MHWYSSYWCILCKDEPTSKRNSNTKRPYNVDLAIDWLLISCHNCWKKVKFVMLNYWYFIYASSYMFKKLQSIKHRLKYLSESSVSVDTFTFLFHNLWNLRLYILSLIIYIALTVMQSNVFKSTFEQNFYTKKKGKLLIFFFGNPMFSHLFTPIVYYTPTSMNMTSIETEL